MTAIRHILSDRILATALAVVIAYLLVLQAAVGGYARASTISAMDEPLHVICASYGVTSTAPETTDNPLGKSADCPCAMLCRLAGSMVPAVAATFTFIISPVITVDHRTGPVENVLLPQQQRRLLAEPRAPPRLS